jgi:dihydroorotase
MMDREGGIVLKTNPPLRPQPMPALMLERLLAGEIDWIETDHAPHTLAEKSGAGAASGIPTLPFHPKFIKMLSEKGLSEEWIKEVTHDAICRTFGISIPMSGRAPEFDLTIEYQFDPFGMAGF